MSSNLMPGYNDDYFDQPCEVCEKHPDDCECPECPKCGMVGTLNCYEFHGLEMVNAEDDAERQERGEAEIRQHARREGGEG